MEYILLFILEIVLLFTVSKRAKTRLVRRLYKITKSQKSTIYIFSVLFLPGTYLHEGAHLLTAVLLGVPAGKFTLMPEFEDGGLKMGSVSVAKTSFVKMALIGAAPLLLGIVGILTCSYLLFIPAPWYVKGVLLYSLFAVSSTMFLSSSDRISLPPFIALVLGVLVALYILGVKLPTDLSDSIVELVKYANFYLLIPLGLNMLAMLL